MKKKYIIQIVTPDGTVFPYKLDSSTMTVSQLASLGGKARAKKLSSKRRKEIASHAGKSRSKSNPNPPL